MDARTAVIRIHRHAVLLLLPVGVAGHPEAGRDVPGRILMVVR
jgi:hypothetical protein